MKMNRMNYERYSYEETECRMYCRDYRCNMENNWSGDCSWDTRETIESYMSRHSFSIETILFGC